MINRKSVNKDWATVYAMVPRAFKLSALLFGSLAVLVAASLLLVGGEKKAQRTAQTGGAQSVAAALSVAPSAEAVSLQGFREVVRQQMEAIKARDESAAYEYISPDIREKYDDAQTFFRVLRFGYRPLYRHMNYSFLRSAVAENVAWQRVELTGPDGKPDIAIIRLTRQGDGEWLIDGYTVLRSEHEPL